MSYQSRRPSRTRVPRSPLGGLLEDLLGSATTIGAPFGASSAQVQIDEQCDLAAASDQQVLQRQAQIDDLQANWNPTGFYTADQLGEALGLIMRMTEPITQAIGVAQANLQLPQHRQRLLAALDSVQGAIGVGGLGVDPLAPYAAAANTVRLQVGGDGVIEATGFKRTCVNILKKVRDATQVLVSINCARPGLFFSILSSLDRGFTAVVDFLKQLVNLVFDAARTIAKIPDAVGTFFTIAKWAALIGGSYWVATKVGIVPAKYDPLRLRD